MHGVRVAAIAWTVVVRLARPPGQDTRGAIHAEYHAVKNIVAFSGGKDSAAVLGWLRKAGVPFTAVFCDTSWEHPVTYRYIEEINQLLCDGKLVTVRSHHTMQSLVLQKKRVPSIRARFCTEALKVTPMVQWLQEQDDEITYYQGIRADESARRAQMKPREWSDVYDCWIERPLFYWTADQVFTFLQAEGIPVNPLYRLGAKRVGCFPCVLISHGELRQYTVTMPDVWDRIKELEWYAGRSFFHPHYIPERFMTGVDNRTGKPFPTVDDVQRYFAMTQTPEAWEKSMEPPSCMSHYNLCE